MATHQRSASVAATREKTYFEQQREELIGEIAMVRRTKEAREEEEGERVALTVTGVDGAELRACPGQYQQAKPLARGRHCGRAHTFFLPPDSIDV